MWGLLKPELDPENTCEKHSYGCYKEPPINGLIMAR